MYIHNCPECGKQYSTQERVSRVKCPYCGAETNVSYAEQEKFQDQWRQFSGQATQAFDSVFSNGPSGKSRGVAGLLAILMGAFGLHYFYVNKTTPGIIFLVASILTCGVLAVVTEVIAIIQCVLFFTMTQEEFEQKWVNPLITFPLF